MVQRTQVALDAEIHRRAKRRASELGISFAAYIRRLVAADVGDLRPVVDPSSIFDLGDSGGSDITANKDEYVADAVEAAQTVRAPGRRKS
ncbi:MAG: hypothetical protein ABIS18_01595 [Actinomycetota bacterium]